MAIVSLIRHLMRLTEHLVRLIKHLVRLTKHLMRLIKHLVRLTKHLVRLTKHLVRPIKHLVRLIKHLVRLTKHLVRLIKYLVRLIKRFVFVCRHLRNGTAYIVSVTLVRFFLLKADFRWMFYVSTEQPRKVKIVRKGTSPLNVCSRFTRTYSRRFFHMEIFRVQSSFAQDS